MQSNTGIIDDLKESLLQPLLREKIRLMPEEEWMYFLRLAINAIKPDLFDTVECIHWFDGELCFLPL